MLKFPTHSPSPNHPTPPPPPTHTHRVYYFIISYEFFKLKKARLLFYFELYIVSLENWEDMGMKFFEFQLLWSNIVISYEYFEGKKASHLFLFQTVYCITGKLAGYVYQIVWISIILIQYFHSNTYTHHPKILDAKMYFFFF